MDTKDFDQCIVRITELQSQIEIEEQKLLKILSNKDNTTECAENYIPQPMVSNTVQDIFA